MTEEGENLKWMYKGLSGHVDREEYLTGRRIDKTFELIRAEETGKSKGDLDIDGADVVPQSVLEQPAGSSSLVTVDVLAKLREDPLYDIKKKEIDMRMEILNNPIKLKKLRSMLKKTLSSDSDSESSDDNDGKPKVYKNRSKHKFKGRWMATEPEENDRHRSSHRSDSYRHSHDSRRRRSRSRSKDHRRRSRSHSKDRHRKRSRSRSMERHERRQDNHSSHSRHKDRSSDAKRRSSKEPQLPSTSSKQSANVSNKSRYNKPTRPKLTPEELEQRRQAMMSDAATRETERKVHVTALIEQEKKEIEQQSTARAGAGFIRDELHRTLNEDTLEKRIKQNSFKSQKTRNMDTSFARK